MATTAQAFYYLCNVDGIPNKDGIRQQAQATGLVHDLSKISRTELALIRKENMLGQTLKYYISCRTKLCACILLRNLPDMVIFQP